MLQQVILVAVFCGCRGDIDFLAAHQSFLFSLTFGTIIEDLLSLGSELRPFLSGKIALCVSNIYTIEQFLTIMSLCLSYIAATKDGIPTTTTCMISCMTIREDLSNLGTELSCSVIEGVTVAVATDLDASSELRVICIDLLQHNLDLLTISLRLVVLPKGVKCVFKTSCVSLEIESGIIIVKGLIDIGTSHRNTFITFRGSIIEFTQCNTSCSTIMTAAISVIPIHHIFAKG